MDRGCERGVVLGWLRSVRVPGGLTSSGRDRSLGLRKNSDVALLLEAACREATLSVLDAAASSYKKLLIIVLWKGVRSSNSAIAAEPRTRGATRYRGGEYLAPCEGAAPDAVGDAVVPWRGPPGDCRTAAVGDVDER